MGIDVYLISDDDIKKQKEFDEKNIEYNMFTDKIDGSTGYLRKPFYIPDDCDNDTGEAYIDFLKETPKALDHMINCVYLNDDCFKKFLSAIEDLNLDTRMDANLTINALNQVKSVVIRHRESCHDEHTVNRHSGLVEWTADKNIELIDFFIYGIKLQLAGKHPRVSVG